MYQAPTTYNTGRLQESRN